MSSCQGRTTLGFYVKESVLKHLAYLFESVFRYIKVGFYRRIFLWVLWIFLTSFSKQHLMNSCLCLSLDVSLKYLHLIKQSKKTELIWFTFFLNFTTWCSFWNVWRSGSFCCIQKLSEKFSVSYFSKCNFDTCIIKRLKEWKNLIKSSLQMQSCKKVALKNFVRFTGKHLCWSPFLITFQTWEPASNSGVFLWILQNF